MNAPAWDRDLAHMGPREHIHAIGMFALCFNELEIALFAFLEHYLPDNAAARVHLFASLHNQARVDLIRRLAAQEPDAEREAISFAMNCFGVCAENRNLLLHALPGGEHGDKIVVYKEAVNERGFLKRYGFSLEELRSGAKATNAVALYMFALCEHLRVCRETSARPMTGPRPRPTLPQRPPQPRKLSLSRLLEAPEGDQLPPEPSFL